MSFLIRGMEMPKGKDVLTVAITADGEVYSIGFDNTIEGGIFLSHPSTYPIQAVLVPTPHGRLIDADKQDAQIEALIERHLHGYTKSTWDFVCELRDILKRNPTIIPAEEVET